jgi:hypothetical protein
MKIPKPKIQIPNKFQAPNSKAEGVRRIGSWNLKFGFCLEFGFWYLEFPVERGS